MSDFMADFVGTVPGSFVSVKGEVAKSQSGGVAECIRNSTTRPLDHSATSSVDGGFITGPGLDEAAKVVGVVDTVAHCLLPNSCLPDHRAYDAAVKAETEKDATAQVIADLIAARRCLILAVAKLERSGLGSIDERVRTIAGINGISEQWFPCGCCGLPFLTATVNMKVSELLSVVITWQREVRP